MSRYLLAAALLFLAPLAALAQAPKPPEAPKPSEREVNREYVQAHYTKYEYRIPMRDGARLFTAVYVPKEATNLDRLYPILLIRTPYSCQPYGVDKYPNSLRPGDKFAKA